ncbi:hypothetical protein [Vibrio mediterranei]|uniref:hypothetical protein n=1 Tax=Vibrio mediterranei TaxID=689 RepID=UPI00148D0FD1|nr:hypothetical protein [Vibrio mediterranei]NOH31702.1 hypothetical protein [Vibrio mediterranei]
MKLAISLIFLVAAFALYIANYGFSAMSEQLASVDEFTFTFSVAFLGIFTLMLGLGIGILIGRKS